MTELTLYVCGFLLAKRDRVNPDVLLILKNRPKWQAGRLNGIGGKIEPGETPLEAMDREFNEEAGLRGLPWEPVAILHGPDFEVHFFSVLADSATLNSAQARTDEELAVVNIADMLFDDRILPNLHVLVPLALDRSGIVKPVLILDGIVDAANTDVPPEKLSFGCWLDRLNQEAGILKMVDAPTFWQVTGSDAWQDYYDDGLSPRDALLAGLHP